jgi:hypothetical protein
VSIDVGPVELRGIASARACAWAAGAGPAGDEVIVDVDSTIIRTKADKQDAAATYKRPPPWSLQGRYRPRISMNSGERWRTTSQLE